jgi:hypothetical protein
LTLVLLAVPIFYVVITGGGEYLGYGSRFVRYLPELADYARFVSMLASPVCVLGLTLMAIISTIDSGTTRRARIAGWLAASLAFPCGLIALVDIAASFAL